MYQLRSFLRRYPAIGLFVVAAAMFVRVAVPSGFMPAVDHGHIVITICTGTGPMTATMAMPGMSHDTPDMPSEHGKADHPCAFSGLSMPSLAAADTILLTIALAFVMALALQPLLPLAPSYTRFLRPPLRGPPAPN